MAVNVSPFGPKPQFELASGAPAVGNQLFFYVGGSVNTKQNTYTDSTGGVANTNPLILNALGTPTTEIWFTTGQSYKVVYAPSTDTDPPSSPIWTIDNLRGINDVTSSFDQWVAGPTPTFVGATSFTLVGDQTTNFHPGRRIKTTNSGGTIYSTVVTSVFGALTTVTVVNDSGTLDAGLSAVSYSLLTATNPSVPLLADTYPVVSGSADKTKKFRFEVDGNTTGTTRVGTIPDYDFRFMSQTHGADIASAATLNLDTATGDLVDVTGTTGITAITLAEGKMATVRFTGILLLTHGASLVLPGAANLTTAAGDFATFRGYAAGVVRLSHYQFAAQSPGGGLARLATGTVSNQATLDIVMTAYTGFRSKKLVADFLPATDAVILGLRVSTDGGSTYDAAAGNYSYSFDGVDSAGTALITGNTDVTNPTSIAMTTTNIGNSSTEGVAFTLELFHTISTALWPKFVWHATFIDNTGSPRLAWTSGSGARRAAQDTDAVRFFFSSGNLLSGSWTLYGYN